MTKVQKNNPNRHCVHRGGSQSTPEHVFEAPDLTVRRLHVGDDYDVPRKFLNRLRELDRCRVAKFAEVPCELFSNIFGWKYNSEIDVAGTGEIIASLMHPSKCISILVTREYHCLSSSPAL
jgi:hypothetical protein